MDNSKYKKLPYIHNIDKTGYFKIPIAFNQDNVINYITYLLDNNYYKFMCSFGGYPIGVQLSIGTIHCQYDGYKSVYYGYGNTINTGRCDSVVSGKGYIKVNGNKISKEKEDAEDWNIGYICIGSDGMAGETISQNFLGCILYNTLYDYNNKIFSHSFIPCKRLKDNVIGIYDLVTDNFYLPTRGKWVAPIDLSEVISIQIPEGNVTKIQDKEGNILWTSVNNQTTTLDT